MSQVHSMLEKVEEATSDWSVDYDVTYNGWRLRHGCVIWGELHKTQATAERVLRRERARAAVRALMEPDEGMVEAGREVCRSAYMDYREANQADAVGVFRAMLLPLVEGDGE